MKAPTHSISWSVSKTQPMPMGKRLAAIKPQHTQALGTTFTTAVNSATNRVIRASIATLVVATILIAAIWASEALAASGVVQAIIWASSLVFLGLAIDSSRTMSLPFLITGLIQGVLSLLSSPENIEFTMLAATVIATWVGLAILQGWKAE